jgi:hypothetical protein
MSLPLKSIEECFEVDMVNYSQLIQELWREYLQLLTVYDNVGYNRYVREQFLSDSKQFFMMNNLTIEPSYSVRNSQ